LDAFLKTLGRNIHGTTSVGGFIGSIGVATFANSDVMNSFTTTTSVISSNAPTTHVFVGSDLSAGRFTYNGSNYYNSASPAAHDANGSVIGHNSAWFSVIGNFGAYDTTNTWKPIITNGAYPTLIWMP